jgi:hypothetical protein
VEADLGGEREAVARETRRVEASAGRSPSDLVVEGRGERELRRASSVRPSETSKVVSASVSAKGSNPASLTKVVRAPALIQVCVW